MCLSACHSEFNSQQAGDLANELEIKCNESDLSSQGGLDRTKMNNNSEFCSFRNAHHGIKGDDQVIKPFVESPLFSNPGVNADFQQLLREEISRQGQYASRLRDI